MWGWDDVYHLVSVSFYTDQKYEMRVALNHTASTTEPGGDSSYTFQSLGEIAKIRLTLNPDKGVWELQWEGTWCRSTWWSWRNPVTSLPLSEYMTLFANASDSVLEPVNEHGPHFSQMHNYTTDMNAALRDCKHSKQRYSHLHVEHLLWS